MKKPDRMLDDFWWEPITFVYIHQMTMNLGELTCQYHGDALTFKTDNSFQIRLIKLNGKIHYLWRAVDQDGCGLDVFVSKSRNKKAALKFFRKLFRTQPRKPTVIITDKLPSYRAALRDIGIEIKHNTQQYANNIAEILKSRYYVWGGIVTNQPRLNYRKDGRLLNVTVRIDDKEEFMWTGH